MPELRKYQDVIPVVSSTGGFYNPDRETNKMGEFYLKVNGIPKAIEISYKGNISLFKNTKFSKKVLISNNNQKGHIFLSSTKPYEYPSEKLFTFSGDIKSIKYVKIYNWASPYIFSSIKNYDKTYILLNKSETNFEDDSIIIRDIKLRNSTHRTIKKRKNKLVKYINTIEEEAKLRLPESYVENRGADIVYDNRGNWVDAPEIRGQYCHNCYFLKLNYCKKWDAKVPHHAWCASWKKKEGVK